MKALSLIFIFFLSFSLKAEMRSSLILSSYVASSIKTKVKESKLSATQSLWILQSQSNSRYPSESQKFEVLGLDQQGLEAHIRKVVGSDRMIQYEVLIKSLQTTLPANKPIFLKISAN